MKTTLCLLCAALLLSVPLLAHADDFETQSNATDAQNAAGATGDGYDPQQNADAARDAANRAEDQSEELDTPDALVSSVKARQAANDAQDAADQTTAHDAGMDGPPPLGNTGPSPDAGADSAPGTFDPGTQTATPAPEDAAPAQDTSSSAD